MAESGRKRRGAVAAVSGIMAENQVAAHYQAAGYQVVAKRWRGEAGEIDLICRKAGVIVFVEVKSAPTHAMAAERLQRRQMNRICQAACEYCGTQPSGQMSEMRFDAALVDSLGQIEITENAFTA